MALVVVNTSKLSVAEDYSELWNTANNIMVCFFLCSDQMTQGQRTTKLLTRRLKPRAHPATCPQKADRSNRSAQPFLSCPFLFTFFNVHRVRSFVLFVLSDSPGSFERSEAEATIEDPH